MAPRVYSTILPTMSQLFSVPLRRLHLRELFVVKYAAGAGGQPKLNAHRDGYELSFSVRLCDSWAL